MAIILFCFYFLGCSSAHQIIFTIPHCWDVPKNWHASVAIVVPDSIMNLISRADISGGLCKGHDFDLEIGKSIADAMQNSLACIYDSVLIINSSRGNFERKFIPKIRMVKANADFSPSGFNVAIKGAITFTLHIDEEISEIKDVGSDAVIRRFFEKDIIIQTESSGKGDDCHDAALYLKKAGDIAMQNLRDSIVARLSPIAR